MMRIAINGTGVAGPTLAWWLKRYGHESVLFERAPALRTGGYMIDFWGVGYQIAEKMGIIPALQKKGYLIESLRLVDRAGQPVATMSTAEMRTLVDERFISIARSDIAATLYHACDGVETRFGTHITGIDQQADGVIAHLSNGAKEQFDLVVGADGLHSQIRGLLVGPEAEVEHSLGVEVAACTVAGYQPRDELTYIGHRAPQRMVSRVSLRDDKTLFLFTFRSTLIDKQPTNSAEAKALLRNVYGDTGWEAPFILQRLDDTDDFYFDHVSQIYLDHWCKGRVALVGDAAACASLLAGEGTGLAMLEAYVLAGELHRAGGDYSVAFRQYEARLQPFLRKKQESALTMVAFFAPKNWQQMTLARLAVQATALPYLSKFLIGRILQDDIELPEYVASGNGH
ncbi:MAG: FAD-binding domain [Caldilineaceae bacterium]